MSFKISNTSSVPENTGVLAPAIKGGGAGGRYTAETGVLAYYEVKRWQIWILNNTKKKKTANF